MTSKKRFQLTPSAYLVLIEDGRTLLSRRYNTGYEDGNYGLVAGHADGNETFTKCVIREVKEESDIDLKAEDLQVAHVMHRKGPDDERVDVFFRATRWSGEPKLMEPEKCDDLTWFALDDLPSNTIPYIRQALEKIQEGLFYSEHGF